MDVVFILSINRYSDSYYTDKRVARPSYVLNGYSCAGGVYSYWNGTMYSNGAMCGGVDVWLPTNMAHHTHNYLVHI